MICFLCLPHQGLNAKTDTEKDELGISNPLVESNVEYEMDSFEGQNYHPKVFVLSLDGGGIRGVVLAKILKHISEKMNVPIDSLFNLIGGTSTGGLIALALATPDDENPEKAKYNCDQILEIYTKRKNEIFIKRRFYSMGLFNSKYTSSGVETFAKGFFGDNLMLSHLKLPVIVTAFNDTQDKLITFGSHSASSGEGLDLPVWQAGRITSAAPYYFTPVIDQNGDVLRDGGLSANNPTAQSIMAIQKIYPDIKLENIIVVSIGTGRTNAKTTKNLTLLGIDKIIKQFEQGQLANVDNIMEAVLKENYIRIQTILPKLKTDETSKAYIQTMLDASDQTILDNQSQFERLESLWNTQFKETGSYKYGADSLEN